MVACRPASRSCAATDVAEADAPVLLIAGGSGAIGSAIARAASAAGWRVVIHGRSRTKLDALVAELGEAACITEDATRTEAAARIVEGAAKVWGRLDAVIDCVSAAPRGIIGAFGKTDPTAYATLMHWSVGHVQRLAHAAFPHLSKQGGTFIAFASDSGLYAAPMQSMIGASRAAIMGFVRNVALEVARDRITVHCISPSFVDETPSALRAAEMAPGRVEKARARAGLGLPTPNDIAPLALFLIGDGARRLTGQVISINGGLNA